MRYVRPREYRLNPRGPIDRLDCVVERFRQNRRTFTEDEALGPLWREGDESRLREDSRFWEIAGCGQFHLARHRLANHRLADRLWQGLWDGGALDEALAGLDDAEPGTFHVFCEIDPHFLKAGATWQLVARPRLPCPEDFAARLDAMKRQLLDEHHGLSAARTTREMLDMAARFDETAEAGDDALDYLESWLGSSGEWVEIAHGLWLPSNLIPEPVQPKPFRVGAVRNGGGGAPDGEMEVLEAGEDPFAYAENQPEIVLPDPPVERHPDASVTWTHTLHTIHLDSGYLPVPTGARFRYPRFVGRTAPLAIHAALHETGQEGILWLDRERHRFYGEFLRSALDWEEAGRKLHLRWGAGAIVITRGEVDLAVQDEERRFIDVESLSVARSALGESYRQSLAQILKEHTEGLAFRSLYDALVSRVHHRPSRASIRAILATAPGLLLKGRNWTWTSISHSDRNRRRSAVLAQLGTDPQADVVDLPSLAKAASSHTSRVLGDDLATW